MNYKTFFLEETGRRRIWLRRFRFTREEDLKPCPLPFKYHNAQTLVGEAAEKKDANGLIDSIPVDFYADDPRWPAQCPCGYVFSVTDDADHFQVFTRTIYRRTDTGEEMIEDDAPVGAIYNAWWMADIPGHAGPDGRFLIGCPAAIIGASTGTRATAIHRAVIASNPSTVANAVTRRTTPIRTRTNAGSERDHRIN